MKNADHRRLSWSARDYGWGVHSEGPSLLRVRSSQVPMSFVRLATRKTSRPRQKSWGGSPRWHAMQPIPTLGCLADVVTASLDLARPA